MSSPNFSHSSNNSSPLPKILFWLFLIFLTLGLGVFAAAITDTPAGQAVLSYINNLFALNSVQTMWYITRASGLVAYLLLWLSTAWGLAVDSKIMDFALHRTFTYDFHQYISLFSLGFLALHMVVLLFDGFMPYSILQILLPFISPYRPFWIGIGVIGMYLMVLVTVTFYMKNQIGVKAFRAIHLLSLLGYLGGLVHSFFSGTDSSLPAAQIMYAGTFLATVFLFVHWLVLRMNNRRPSPAQNSAPIQSPVKSTNRRPY